MEEKSFNNATKKARVVSTVKVQAHVATTKATVDSAGLGRLLKRRPVG